MLRQMAWNTFKHTGNVNTFIELIEIENIQKNMEGNQYGNIEDKGAKLLRKDCLKREEYLTKARSQMLDIM